MELLANLNQNQKEAVMHKEGPCLVLAGAGSGKTRVLTTRIAYLIEQGIPSYNILAITFTNKAAKEMKERVTNLVAQPLSFIGTFHSLGVRILKEEYNYVGLDKNFTILDSDDVLSVIKKIEKELNIDPKFCAPSYVRNRISFIKNENLSLDEIEKFFNTDAEKTVIKIYQEYLEILKKNNSVDFDDLLRLPVKIFRENKTVLEKYQQRYKYILVDEYQDTNEVQYQLIKLLASKYCNLFVVGDANQSIYGFRNANFKNILNFEKDYKGCHVITLEENYRSTENILKIANCVIKNNKERKDLELHGVLGEGVKTKYIRTIDGKDEVETVLNEINNLIDEGYHYKDIAVLYRTNAQARLVEEVFLKHNVAYQVVGAYYFYQRKEIKDLLSYLKLINNPNDDISLRRVINVPKRGIGNVSVDKLEALARSENTSMFKAISNGKELEFKNLILSLIEEAKNLSLTELIDEILLKTSMKEELSKEKNLENELRLDNLEEFKSITASFEERTGSVNLDDFLDEISLIADVSEHKSNNDGVTLMTIHSAKGLEFACVFLIGMEEGIFPHQNSLYEAGDIEEERRLCYVGITRAKERLYLLNAKRRILYGKEEINPVSRFIEEINPDLLDVSENNLFTDNYAKYTSKNGINAGEFTTDYKPGDVVMHNTCGRGAVINVDDKFVTVAFSKRFGIKKVLIDYKGMRRL